jgi:predicted Mrr-cat superfamily restriction endonuclease
MTADDIDINVKRFEQIKYYIVQYVHKIMTGDTVMTFSKVKVIARVYSSYKRAAP